VELRSPDTVCIDLASAVEEALTSRRPVVFNLPAQMQSVDVDCEDMVVDCPTREEVPVDRAALDDALGVVASSLRPAIVAGRGAVDPQARHQILTLAELLGAPLATTLKAYGLFGGETFNLGVCGTVSSSLTAEVLGQADCLIVFGASLNRYTTSYGSLLSDKGVVQVDIDPDAIGRWYQVDRGVIGDSGLVAAEMIQALKHLGERPQGLTSDTLAESIVNYDPTTEFVDASGEDWIDPRTLMVWLDRVLPADRTLVCDVGGFMENPLRYLSVSDPQAHVLPAAFGSVGLSMGTAIGAGLADDSRPTLVVMGDGGWMMGGINGLDTAVRLGLDMVVVVLNDGGYGIEHRALTAKGSDPSIASMAWPQPSRVANVLGSDSLQIVSLADLGRAELAIEQRTSPLVIDARIPV
jgi:thiamine pyrophosphate-dependent acetolactate synthase large subunit-like protein